MLLPSFLLGLLFYPEHGNIPPKHEWTSAGLHSVTSQKTVFFNLKSDC